MLAKFIAGVDYLVPFLDIGFIFFWIPGVILFLFGYPLLFSWVSMLVIPITLTLYGLLRRWQERHVFRRFDIHPARDIRGFFASLSPTSSCARRPSLPGYMQYLTGAARRWK